jgi:peptide/nickel transport system permease protein
VSPRARLSRHAARRLVAVIPTLLLVAMFAFALIRMVPGDPAQVMLGDIADPQALAALRHEWGLDRPAPIQFFVWLRHAISGDLGRSISTGEPVVTLIVERFKVTAPIVLLAVVLATLISVVAGLLAAWRRNGTADLVIMGLTTLGLALPSFWLGLMLLLVFGVDLRWLPVVGYVSPSEDFAAGLAYMVLPVTTLVVTECGVLTQAMRASAIEVLRLDYVTYARAKGVPEAKVLVEHVLPNAFAPTMTLAGLVLGHLLGGAAVVETVFSIPGLGRLVVDSVLARDYPVVQGCLLFTALLYIAVNFMVDLLYPLLDPRVEHV